MKVSVGVLALCLALCHAANPGFKEGKKYIYDYTAKYGTGVSDDAVTQFAGKGWKGQLHVYQTAGHLAIELHDAKVAEFNRRLGSIFEVLHLNYQTPTDADEVKLIKDFEHPWYGVYGDHGKIVASKHTHLKDNVYTNLQRSILSLFQLVFPSSNPHDHFYVVEESGIGGDCQTVYILNHFPDEFEHHEVLNISKGYKYDECSYRPHSLFTSLIGYDCKHCKQETHDQFQNEGRVDYQLKGTRDDYTIEYIYASGYTGYTPFTTNGQTAMSITNQTLHLEEIVDYTPEAVPGDAEKIDGLYYKFEGEKVDYNHEDLKENHVLDRVWAKEHVEDRYVEYFKGEKDHVAQAASLLPKVTPEKLSEYKELAQVTDLLGHVLFTFDYDDFTKFFSEHIKIETDVPEEKDRRNYLMKMLTIVGTNPAILYALEQIETKKLPEKIEMEMLHVLPFYVKTPSMPLLNKYLEFVKSDYINEDHDKLLHSVAWEAWGTLIYRACVKDEYNHHPHHHDTFVGESVCKGFVQHLIEKFEKATESKDKCVYIRAIKNTQTEWAYEYLVKEVIPGHKYNSYIRTTAIWGLEHFVDDNSTHATINELLVPIFTDHNEDYHVRIYAFDVLMYLHQDQHFFAHLLMMINHEPNMQIASYVWSTLSSIANSTDPCYENVAHHARHILPYIERKDYDFDLLRHSTNKIFAFYNEQYGFGRTTQFMVIGGNDTAIPREVYLRQSFNLAGRNFDFAELGGIQRNHHVIDSTLAAFMEQNNLMFGSKKNGDDYGLAKHFDPLDFITKATGELYSRIFNQDVAVAHKFEVPQHSAYITRVGDKTADIHYTKVISGAQVEYVIPNMMGLPTYLHLFAPVVVKLAGTVGYEAVSNADSFNSISLELDLKYVMDIDIKCSMLVDNPFTGASGYELRTDAGIKFPIHGEIEIDIEHEKINTKRIVSDETYDMLYYDTQPSTFTRNYHLLPVKYSDKPVQRQYKFGHNYFGAGLKFQFSYDYYWNDYGSYRTFFKTFFHKSTRYEDYFDLADKWYAGSRGFLDYAVLNPTARPFHFVAKFERSTTNPTEEVVAHYKHTESDYHDEEKTEGKQTWSTKKCEWEIIAKGPTPRKWNIELEVDRHWPLVDFRRLKFHWKRSPIPNYDDKPYEICFESDTKIHGRHEIVLDPLHPTTEAKMEYEATLRVGPDCASSSKKIEFKGELTKSKEQHELDHEKLYIYQKCKEDQAKGYEYSYACWMVKKDQGRLDHLKMDIEYDANINPKVKEFFHKIYLWFRHTYYNNLYIEREFETGVEENHIKLEANVSYFQPIADIHVYRPHEIVHYHKVFVPSIIPRYEPVTIMEPFGARYWRRSMRLQRPMCFLSGDYVYTLDGVSYKYPLGNCYHVAVANCMRENVVLMYKAAHEGKYTKAMKLVVNDHYVEIIPEGGKLVVYVDGTKHLEGDEHIYIQKSGDDEVFAIYPKFAGYTVKAKSSGLKVYFDGKNTKIKVSNLFHGVQCGMCGDFNNEKAHEFRHVDGTHYRDPAEFAHSYAIHKDGCHA